MKKSQRLQVIVNLNAENEKKALEVFGHLQIEKKSMQSQLDNLQLYLQEYKDKYQGLTGSGISINRILEFRAFISKLDKAIDEQQQAILKKNSVILTAQNHWESAHQKTKSLEKICDVAMKAERIQDDRKEQAEQDERATRSGKNNGTRNAWS